MHLPAPMRSKWSDFTIYSSRQHHIHSSFNMAMRLSRPLVSAAKQNGRSIVVPVVRRFKQTVASDPVPNMRFAERHRKSISASKQMYILINTQRMLFSIARSSILQTSMQKSPRQCTNMELISYLASPNMFSNIVSGRTSSPFIFLHLVSFQSSPS